MSSPLGLVIGGARVPVPGVAELVTWLDDPHVAPPITHHTSPRKRPPTAIVLHTSRGVRGTVRPGSFPSSRAELLAHYQARTERKASWDLTIDGDGTVIQQSDPATNYTWHACHANGWSIGIECVQQRDSGDLWSVQLDALVAVVGVLCEAFQIPTRTIVNGDGKPHAGIVRAWQEADEGGRQGSWAGVIGHRNLTTHRGDGDPGDGVFDALLVAGFSGVPVPT